MATSVQASVKRAVSVIGTRAGGAIVDEVHVLERDVARGYELSTACRTVLHRAASQLDLLELAAGKECEKRPVR